MYCRASATDWIRSSCLMMVMAAASTPGVTASKQGMFTTHNPSIVPQMPLSSQKDRHLRGRLASEPMFQGHRTGVHVVSARQIVRAIRFDMLAGGARAPGLAEVAAPPLPVFQRWSVLGTVKALTAESGAGWSSRQGGTTHLAQRAL